MSNNEDPLSEEFVTFRILTPDEILQSVNRQVILTPKEKFEKIQKHLDKRARRLRKYHFVAIETTHLLYVFDGEGEEIGQFANSVDGCREARKICIGLFLSAENQNGGYSFSGPNFENLTPEEYDQRIFATRKHLDYHRFQKNEVVEWNYDGIGDFSEADVKPRKNYCWKCDTQCKSAEKFAQHLCTENWIMTDFGVYSRNFGIEGRISVR